MADGSLVALFPRLNLCSLCRDGRLGAAFVDAIRGKESRLHRSTLVRREPEQTDSNLELTEKRYEGVVLNAEGIQGSH